MADQVITVTIPDAKVSQALLGFLKMHPNEELNPDGSKKYTDKQHIKNILRGILVREINMGLSHIAQESANVPYDDGMVI